jgi:HTH-type transcriptional regulator/antitoxin HigA
MGGGVVMADNNEALIAPGEYIRDELEARGWTQEAFAHILGRPLKTVNQIITGAKAITPQTAQEIAAAFGTSAELWMNLEGAYRLQKERLDSRSVTRRAKLHDVGPVKEMMTRGWLPDTDDVSKLEEIVSAFFSEPFEAAARKSTSYGTTTPAQRAWMYFSRKLARQIDTDHQYDEARARKLLPELHALTVSEHEVRRVPAMLSKMGIRLVIVKHLQGTHIDGATFWLDDGAAPVIALSLRFGRIDNFWFTLCHELMHVLHGDKYSVDTDLVGPSRSDTSQIPEIEARANSEASAFLVPTAKLKSFIARHPRRVPKVDIIRFANLLQVHPGIVVGQLHHHHNAVKYSHSREMLPDIRIAITDSALTDGWGHSSTD